MKNYIRLMILELSGGAHCIIGGRVHVTQVFQFPLVHRQIVSMMDCCLSETAAIMVRSVVVIGRALTLLS